MPNLQLHIRRCRRTDFTGVMRLLADPALAAPLPDRRTLRRFRAIVNDLGGDLYVALVDGELAGIVHATYARRLAGAPRACLEQVVVDGRFRRCGIGTALVELIRGRAIRRGCGKLHCSVSPRNVAATEFLAKLGLNAEARIFAADLEPERSTDEGDQNENNA